MDSAMQNLQLEDSSIPPVIHKLPNHDRPAFEQLETFPGQDILKKDFRHLLEQTPRERGTVPEEHRNPVDRRSSVHVATNEENQHPPTHHEEHEQYTRQLQEQQQREHDQEIAYERSHASAPSTGRASHFSQTSLATSSGPEMREINRDASQLVSESVFGHGDVEFEPGPYELTLSGKKAEVRRLVGHYFHSVRADPQKVDAFVNLMSGGNGDYGTLLENFRTLGPHSCRAGHLFNCLHYILFGTPRHHIPPTSLEYRPVHDVLNETNSGAAGSSARNAINLDADPGSISAPRTPPRRPAEAVAGSPSRHHSSIFPPTLPSQPAVAPTSRQSRSSISVTSRTPALFASTAPVSQTMHAPLARAAAAPSFQPTQGMFSGGAHTAIAPSTMPQVLPAPSIYSAASPSPLLWVSPPRDSRRSSSRAAANVYPPSPTPSHAPSPTPTHAPTHAPSPTPTHAPSPAPIPVLTSVSTASSSSILTHFSGKATEEEVDGMLTTYTVSISGGRLDQPPLDALRKPPMTGDLLFNQFPLDSQSLKDAQVWIYLQEPPQEGQPPPAGQWVEITDRYGRFDAPPVSHPRIPNRMLTIRYGKKAGPNWIKADTWNSNKTKYLKGKARDSSTPGAPSTSTT